MTETVQKRCPPEQEIRQLVNHIQTSWHKSADVILECGKSLERLKSITSRTQFLTELKTIGMSEQTAMRILKCWRRWGANPTPAVLSSNPAVLYIVAASADERTERLVRGGAINIEGKKRTLKTLTVAEAKKLKKKQPRLSRRIGKRSHDAHRDFVTLLNRVQDFVFNGEEVFSKLDPKHRRLVAISIRETMECLKKLPKQLQ